MTSQNTQCPSASRGFVPVSNASARVLILGTLPGQASLQRGEYYSQPRNKFWHIMDGLFGISPQLSYAERVKRLISHHIALWDVCHSAHRPGSLDTAITSDSIVPNDFEVFFNAHPGIRLVCFNGTKATALYEHLVLPRLPVAMRRIRSLVLPSTSAAHASLRYEDKLLRWTVVRITVDEANQETQALEV